MTYLSMKKVLLILEKLRQRLGLFRSAIIDKAISFWLKRQQEEELVKKYEDSYRKKPENVSEIMAREKAGMEALEEGLLYCFQRTHRSFAPGKDKCD